MHLRILLVLVGAAAVAEAESAFQEVVRCAASEVVEGLAASQSPMMLHVLPCRNLAGLDAPALQQVAQMLQSEIATRAGGRVALSTMLSSLDLEAAVPDASATAAVDLWLEPAVAFDGKDLVLSAKLFSSTLALDRYLFCSRPASVAEVQLFSQAPPVIPGVDVQRVFESHPLPFHTLDLAVQKSADGITQIAFLGDAEILLFELRDTTLVMKDRIALPAAAAGSRDLRGSIWWGTLGGGTVLLAQRSNEPVVHAFTISDGRWVPVQAPVAVVPFEGSGQGVMAGGLWQVGRNFMSEIQTSRAVGSGQTQPLPSGLKGPWYSGTILASTDAQAPKLVLVRSDSSLCVSTIDGKRAVTLPLRCGDAIVATVISGEPAVISSLAGSGEGADGLCGTRLNDGVVLFEQELPGKTVEMIRMLDGRLYILLEAADGAQTMQMLELRAPGQTEVTSPAQEIKPEESH